MLKWVCFKVWIVHELDCITNVRFYSKNKFEKLAHLAGFIIRIFVCRIFLSSLTLSYTYSLLTRSVLFIISIFLQHHISKQSRYFWSTFRSAQISAPYQAMSQMYFISSVLKLKSNWLVQMLCWMLHFPWKFLDSFLSAFIFNHYTENRGRVCGTSACYSQFLGSNHCADISPLHPDKFL
jgi:hypothetical protein